MIKHICGQAIYQVAVLTVLIFAGDKFIPENLPDVTDANGKSIVYAPGGKYVRSGRLKYPFSFEDDYQTVIFSILLTFCLIRFLISLDIWTFAPFHCYF